MADYVDIETARAMPGLRLVLTAGLPGPWGEAAKGIFHAKGIYYARVAQSAGDDNDELFDWTGHRNAPVAIYEDEPPRAGWAEILWLAERLRPEPALVPGDPEQRVVCMGLSQELMGENGLGWCRRLMLLNKSLGDAEEPPEALRPVLGRMVRQYGYRRAAAETASARVAGIVAMFSRRLAAQRKAGSRYLVGDGLTAVDIYWSAMAALLSPLPDDVCAMPPPLRALYGEPGDRVSAALDPALLEHRDFVYREHMEFPLAL
jgi:glutathione S-transferase